MLRLQSYIQTEVSTNFRFIDKELGMVFDLRQGSTIGYFDLNVLEQEIPNQVLIDFACEIEKYRILETFTVPVLVYESSRNGFKIL